MREQPVVLITGAGGGIGRAIAARYRARGARLVLVDRDAASLQELEGPDVLCLTADITDPLAANRAMQAGIERMGGIDLLVNNAGISHVSTFAETEDAVLHRVMDVNFWGSVHCTRAALPSLRERHGAIAVLSSVAGVAPLVGRTAYAASKHALHGFFDSLREELVEDGVGVTLVCPSFVATGMARRNLDARGAPLGEETGRKGNDLQPDDVARALERGVDRGERLVLVSPVARVSRWMAVLAPRAYGTLMRRSLAPS